MQKYRSSSHYPNQSIARQNENSSSYCHPNLVAWSAHQELCNRFRKHHHPTYHPTVILASSYSCLRQFSWSTWALSWFTWAVSRSSWSQPPSPRFVFRSPGPKTNYIPTGSLLGVESRMIAPFAIILTIRMIILMTY